MEQKRTELNELGEFGLIERIKGNFEQGHQDSITGIGDDTAVIDAMGDQYTLLSTDMLIEGTHFDLSYAPLKHLGYKAVAVNVSDIAAMNGIPQQITVGLGISNRFSLEAIDTLYEGIKKACEAYHVDLVGGDTTSSSSGLVISISILGKVNKSSLTLRSGAKKGDILCASGDLGGAYMGFQVLEREKQVFLTNPEMQPELGGYDYIVQRQLKPEGRTDIIHELNDLNIVPTAMMDLSDGLASDLPHLCKASHVGAHIFEDKLPIHKMTYETCVEFDIGPVTAALNGGEDYELLFTISQDDHEKVKNHHDITMIGYVTGDPNELKLVTKSGTAIDLKSQGWKHF